MRSCGGARAASLVVCLPIVLAVAAAPAAAQGCLEEVGQWPYGPAAGVAVAGDHVYFGSGAALMIADVSDPATPQVVGEVALPGFVQNLAFSGGYAYVVDIADGLRVIDVTTPSAPVEVGFVDTPGVSVAVTVADGHAYVADYDSLRIIDVSDPSAPAEVGFLETPGLVWGVAVAGSYAFVAGSDSLRVIDVTTPSAPVEVGSVAAGNANLVSVAVANGYAYAADFNQGGLHVIDIGTPSAPAIVAFADLPSRSSQVAMAGNHVYVANSDGLWVIDVSDPLAPVEVGFVDTPGAALRVAVGGGHAYVGDWWGGLRVIDVGAPSAPVEASFIATPGNAQAVAIAEGFAYVGFDPWGFSVIDVSEPANPIELGAVDTAYPAIGVAVVGGYAYLAAYTSGLRVIDVRNPASPVEVGFVDTPGNAYDVAVAGGYAYVADYHRGLQVIDVSQPSAPVVVGSVDPPGFAWDVAVSGHYAYLANGAGGLSIIDVATPSAPVEVGSIRPTGSATAVAVSGRYAYLANGSGGLRIIDVSTPSAPVELGFWATSDNVEMIDVAVALGHAYLVGRAPVGFPDELRVVDVTAPSTPVEVGYLTARGHGYTVKVAVSAGEVYTVLAMDGLRAFAQCGSGPSADPRESYVPAAAVAAGAEGAFFQTDLELNNRGAEAAEVVVEWLPRGVNNSDPVASDPIALEPGQSLRYENVLGELFGLEPDSAGALKLVASTEEVLGMSRTYNVPGAKAAGTFGQGLAAVRATEMIPGGERRRLLFLSEDADSRANVGCVNATASALRINLALHDAAGAMLETRTMDLAPYSNNQVNRIFQAYQPVDGTVEVWANRADGLFFCYGSVLDNETSDPTTILPQSPTGDRSFVAAAALAAGLEGAFFETDVDLANVGATDLSYQLKWLPRGQDNTDPVTSETFTLAAGAGVRYANVLDEVFGLAPDQAGALALEASGIDLLAMSRTYNLPSAKVAGTFGQELPGIPLEGLMATSEKRRIIFMNETDDLRSNVGCMNAGAGNVRVNLELFNAAGESLETKTMDLPPRSNNQITRIFRDHAPISAGYVDVWTNTPHAMVTCYGSVLDNLTSDPTTVLPQ